MNKGQTRPTDCSVVLAYLVGLDDFAKRDMIRQGTSLTNDRVCAALAHLARYKAIEAVPVHDELWWMATPERDTRIRVVKETQEGIKRRRRPASARIKGLA